MKHKIAVIASVMLALNFPASVHANDQLTPMPAMQQKSMQDMQCPMMKGMDEMHKDMGSMMSEMKDMSKMATDAKMKEHMQQMQSKMGSMMEKMKDCMAQCKEMEKKMTNDMPSVAPEDHKNHH